MVDLDGSATGAGEGFGAASNIPGLEKRGAGALTSAGGSASLLAKKSSLGGGGAVGVVVWSFAGVELKKFGTPPFGVDTAGGCCSGSVFAGANADTELWPCLKLNAGAAACPLALGPNALLGSKALLEALKALADAPGPAGPNALRPGWNAVVVELDGNAGAAAGAAVGFVADGQEGAFRAGGTIAGVVIGWTFCVVVCGGGGGAAAAG